MRFLVLMGSPRKDGNTAELCRPFIGQLEESGAEVVYLPLEDMNIAPCCGCYSCQQVEGSYGCAINDDMNKVVEEIRRADVLVLATPIFAWYCSAKMKCVLDRHYGLNKYYGSAEGSLWAGKSVAVIATHGYEQDYATEPFITGVKRLCEHSQLSYIGMYSVQDTDDKASFQTAEAVSGAREFALKLLERAAAHQ